MSFGSVQYTNKGRDLQAKAQAGAQLNFTRIAVGDGELSGQAIAALNALISPIKSITLTKFRTLPGGKAVLGGIFSNQDLASGFYWRELGLFANDPDLGEILYCYGNAGALAEYIPSPGGAEVLEKRIDIVAMVGNATNITATLEQSLVFATQEDFDYLQVQIDAKETPAGAQTKANSAAAAALGAANIYTDGKVAAITTASIGAETPAGAQAKVDAHAGQLNNPHNVTVLQIGAAPISHVGAGGTAHANAVAGGASGFMTGSDKSKLDNVISSKWELISDITLAVSAALVDFTGLSVYKMLRLTAAFGSATTEGELLLMQCNGDSGNNYRYFYIHLTGISHSSYNSMIVGTARNEALSGLSVIMINNIDAAAIKLINFNSVQKHSSGVADFNIYSGGGVWNNTANLISSLRLLLSGSNIRAGSRFILEGVK